MFGVSSKGQYQPSNPSKDKITTRFGHSYDYFDRSRTLLLGDGYRLKQKDRARELKPEEDEVFCNINALESDLHPDPDNSCVQSQPEQGLPSRPHQSRDNAYHHSSKLIETRPLSKTPFATSRQKFQNQFDVNNSYNPPRTNSWTCSPKTPEARKPQHNSLFFESPRHRTGCGTQHYPPSPLADYHPSPTTPDEGYSTGTNSTTSISSPLSASLASEAFFDACHYQARTNPALGNQVATTINTEFDVPKPSETESRDSLTSSCLRGIYSRDKQSLAQNAEHFEFRDCGDTCRSETHHYPGYLAATSAATMQRGPIQKGPSLHQFGRKALSTSSIPAVKRRDVPSPSQRDFSRTAPTGSSSSSSSSSSFAQDGNNSFPVHTVSSLEDRLRALTTIEEEDIGTSDRQTQNNLQQSKIPIYLSKHVNHDGQRRQGDIDKISQRFGSEIPPSSIQSHEVHTKNIGHNEQFVEATGFFRAVPVQIAQPAANFKTQLGDIQHRDHRDIPHCAENHGQRVQRYSQDVYQPHTAENHGQRVQRYPQDVYQPHTAENCSEDSRCAIPGTMSHQPDPYNSHVQLPVDKPTVSHEEARSMVSRSIHFGLDNPALLDYQEYFQKQVDIPAHNIDPSLKENVSSVDGNRLPDMNINNRLNDSSKDVTAVKGNITHQEVHRDQNLERNSSLQHTMTSGTNHVHQRGEHVAMVTPLETESSAISAPVLRSSVSNYHSFNAPNYIPAPIGNNGVSQDCEENPPLENHPAGYQGGAEESQSKNTLYVSDSTQLFDHNVEYYNIASSMPDLRGPHKVHSSFHPSHEIQRALYSRPQDTCRVEQSIERYVSHNENIVHSQQNLQRNQRSGSEAYLYDQEKQLQLQQKQQQEIPSHYPMTHLTDGTSSTDRLSPSVPSNASYYNRQAPYSPLQHHQSLYNQQHDQQPQQDIVYQPQGISELQHSATFEVQAIPESITMRRPYVNGTGRLLSNHTDRYSWQPQGSYDIPGLGGPPEALQRSSLDLGNLPQLERQIRASSELCLQASRRHMFASSADIYKLFSSHRHRPSSSLASPSSHLAQRNSSDAEARVSPSTNESSGLNRGKKGHRHSLHTSNPSSYTATAANRLQFPSSSFNELLQRKHNGLSDEVIIPGDQIMKQDINFQYSLPQNPASHQFSTSAISPGTSLGTQSVNIAQHDLSHRNTSPSVLYNPSHVNCLQRNSFSHIQASPGLIHAAPINPTHCIQSPQAENLAPQLLPELYGGVDSGPQVPPLQRQSSGYSSETELQQIESNARAVKKHFHRSRKLAKETRPLPEPRNPTQEFIALNTSADHDSTTTAGTEESTADEFVPIDVGNRRSYSAEPVYVNQIMLGRGAPHKNQTPEAGESHSDDIPPPLPARRQRPASVSLMQQTYAGFINPAQMGPCHSSQAPLFFEAPSGNEGEHYLSPLSYDFQNERQLTELQQQQRCLPQPSRQHLLRHPLNRDFSSNNSTIRDAPVFTQNQIINFQRRPVTITSHIPLDSFSENNKNLENTSRQQSNNKSQNLDNVNNDTIGNSMANNDDNSSHVKTHDANSHSWKPSDMAGANDNINRHHPHSRNFLCDSGVQTGSRRDLSLAIHQTSAGSRELDKPDLVSSLVAPATDRGSSSNSSVSLPLSPLEVAQVLEVPFATNIISDEQGDRLSTLV